MKKEYCTIGDYTFQVVKGWGASGQQLQEKWEWMSGTDIYDLYERPSSAKRQAWQRCQKMCSVLHGRRLRCGNANCYQFSAAFWLTSKEGSNILVYITKDSQYLVVY